MALSTSQKYIYERNFGHCIVSWKIKNFSLAVCNPEAEIFTTEFTVSSLKVTRWRVGFRVESDGNGLQILLQRIGGESDESFRVSWKITILNLKDEATFVSENRKFIHTDSEHKVDVISPLDIIRSLPAEKSDEVKISFQMIVLMNTPMCIPTPKDVGLTALIEDMKVMAKEGFLSDITVMLSEKNMKAHRAVLCQRSKKFSRHAGCQTRIIHLYHLSDTDAVSNIFAYLYTGDLKFILDPPSISTYDYIVYLDIKELRDAYPQEKLTLETAVEATNFDFRWKIPDFNSSEPRESEIYETDGMNCTWKLRIYPKALTEGAELQRTYVYIEAIAVSVAKTQDVYVNFIAKNDKGLVTVAKRTYGKIESSTQLGVFFMRIGGPSMAKSVVNNVLDISFSVYIATGEIKSTVIETQPPVQFNLSNIDTYKIFTNYMGLLQTDSICSDITLVVQEQEFKSHKFILAGRSAILSRMITGMNRDSTTLPLQNMNKRVFRVFLDFLYRGALTDVQVNVLVNLYDMAGQLQVKSVQTVCAKHLADQLTPENCCYLLLFAEERHAASLKTRALHYLDAYRDIILNTEGWRRLELKNQQFFFDVVQFLGNETAVPQEIQR